jgi:hypothetical protein
MNFNWKSQVQQLRCNQLGLGESVVIWMLLSSTNSNMFFRWSGCRSYVHSTLRYIGAITSDEGWKEPTFSSTVFAEELRRVISIKWGRCALVAR